MKLFKNNLSRWHLRSFLWIYVIFTILISFIAYMGIDKHDNHTALFILTTLGSISGPMVGAISREFQSCCLTFSLDVMMVAAPILFLGILLQWIRFPDKKWIRKILRGIWVFAWISWFLLGIFTFGHALS
jgi:hypothetical protein